MNLSLLLFNELREQRLAWLLLLAYAKGVIGRGLGTGYRYQKQMSGLAVHTWLSLQDMIDPHSMFLYFIFKNINI